MNHQDFRLPQDPFLINDQPPWPRPSLSTSATPPLSSTATTAPLSATPVLIPAASRRSKLDSPPQPGQAPPVDRSTSSAGNLEKSRRKSSKASTAKSEAPRQLQFVNATDPYRNRDPDVRMLVRSHVMKGVKRDEKAKLRAREKKIQQDKAFKRAAENPPQPPANSSDLLQKSDDLSNDHAASDSSLTPPPASYGGELSGATMSLYGTSPLTSRPESHKLLFYYRSVIGSAVYPFASRLAFNPVDTSWIPLALQDDVFFSTILFSAASHLSFIQGQRNAMLPGVILESVFKSLTMRLQTEKNVSDGTVGAVTCLAQVENMRGNEAQWKLHMAGLQSIMKARGAESIDEQMQLKIYRADVEGAVNFVTKSQLPPIIRNQPSLETAIPAGLQGCLTNTGLIESLKAAGVRSELVDSFARMYRFSRALEYVLMNHDMLINPASYDEDVVVMQLELVSIGIDEEVGLNRALRLSGMMYVKSTIRGAGVAPPSSRRLLLQLKDTLLVLGATVQDVTVYLWILFIGAVGSRGLPEHFWFLQRLRDLMAKNPHLRTWDDCSTALKKMLWVEPIHKVPCKLQFDEIGVNNLYTASL